MNLKLFYDGGINGLTSEQIKNVEEFITPIPYISMATNNPQTGARLSALSNLPNQKATELYFITDLSSIKAKNMLSNSSVEIMYATNEQGLVVFIGKVEILRDMETKKAKYQPWVDEFFAKGINDENLCVIKFSTQAIRAMIF